MSRVLQPLLLATLLLLLAGLCQIRVCASVQLIPQNASVAQVCLPLSVLAQTHSHTLSHKHTRTHTHTCPPTHGCVFPLGLFECMRMRLSLYFIPVAS